MKVADVVVVPLQPSLFDMQATHAFLSELREHKRAGKVRIGLVGMRVKEHTIAQERFQEFVATLGIPLITTLRDTQNYVHLAAHGLTLFDVAPGKVERDLAQFAPLGAGWCSRPGRCRWNEDVRFPARPGGARRPGDRHQRLARRDAGAHRRVRAGHRGRAWIHVDPARAAAGPFGTTVAHGFLTLSLLPDWPPRAFQIADVRMGVNYGLDRVRFPSPVPVDSRLRGLCVLRKFESIDGGAQLTMTVTIEREGGAKPVCVAEWITRHFV